MFRRLKAAYSTLRLVGVIIKTWYKTNKYEDEMKQIGQEIAECDECSDPPDFCDTHEQMMDQLMEQIQ